MPTPTSTAYKTAADSRNCIKSRSTAGWAQTLDGSHEEADQTWNNSNNHHTQVIHEGGTTYTIQRLYLKWTLPTLPPKRGVERYLIKNFKIRIDTTRSYGGVLDYGVASDSDGFLNVKLAHATDDGANSSDAADLWASIDLDKLSDEGRLGGYTPTPITDGGSIEFECSGGALLKEMEDRYNRGETAMSFFLITKLELEETAPTGTNQLAWYTWQLGVTDYAMMVMYVDYCVTTDTDFKTGMIDINRGEILIT